MLYVLIDLLGDVSSADLQAVREQATRAYWSMQGSVTAALRAALTAANQWLMDYNTHASLPERLTGGMVCSVLRGGPPLGCTGLLTGGDPVPRAVWRWLGHA